MTTRSSAFATALHAVVFLVRLPLFVGYATVYLFFLHHLPLPAVARKLLLWLLLAIPGIWWVDLQLDGVKRGSLSRQPPSRVPHPGSVIAANFTSPIDALYLAAVFDPVFVAARPRSRKVRRVGLLRAIAAALSPSAQFSDPAPPPLSSSASTNNNNNNNTNHDGLTDLRALIARHPGRVIAVFPECGTTNGKGILPLSPCLLAAPADSAIFPVSIRYTPADVTTPVPGARACAAFLWKLLGRPTHCIRVRIAEAIHNTTRASNGVPPVVGDAATAAAAAAPDAAGEDPPTPEEQQLLDRVGEALARLGRARRVGLTLTDKEAFVAAWTGGRR